MYGFHWGERGESASLSSHGQAGALCALTQSSDGEVTHIKDSAGRAAALESLGSPGAFSSPPRRAELLSLQDDPARALGWRGRAGKLHLNLRLVPGGFSPSQQL